MAKIAGAAATVRPSPRSRSARPAIPGSGLASLDLEAGGQRLIGQPFERAGIGPQGVSRIGRKRAAREHGEAGQREPFRAADLAAPGTPPGTIPIVINPFGTTPTVNPIAYNQFTGGR